MKLEEAKAALLASKTKVLEARTALVAERESEEAQLAKLELERAALEMETLRLERERASEPVYRKACLEHGEHRVARIHTLEGSLVFRPMTAFEADDLDLRQEQLKLDVERGKAATEAAIETLLYPTEAEFRTLIEKYPGLVIEVFKARNKVQSGVREEEKGKG